MKKYITFLLAGLLSISIYSQTVIKEAKLGKELEKNADASLFFSNSLPIFFASTFVCAKSEIENKLTNNRPMYFFMLFIPPYIKKSARSIASCAAAFT